MGSVSDLPSSDPRRPDGFFEATAGGIDPERMSCGQSKPTEPWERLRALAQVLLQGEDADELTDMIFGDKDSTLERKLLKKDYKHHRGTWRTDHIDRPAMSPNERLRYEREAHATGQGRPAFTPAEVFEIREDRKVRGMSYREIADKWNITPRSARSISNGYTYKGATDVA